MKLLAVADALEVFDYADRLGEVVKEAGVEAVLFTGNILKAEARLAEWERARKEGRDPDPDRPEIAQERSGDSRSFARFFRMLNDLRVPCFVVPGKNDAPERFFLQAAFSAEIVNRNVYMVHRSFAPVARNFVVAGFGGEITDGAREHTLLLMYPGWEAQFSLDFVRHLDQEKILLFHTPPEEEFEDGEAGRGHEIVSQIIKTYRPRFVACSRSGGQKGRLWVGDTLVVCPGRLAQGEYAVVDIAERKVWFGNLR